MAAEKGLPYSGIDSYESAIGKKILYVMADNQPGSRMPAPYFPDQLQRFFVSDTGDGTCVDQINFRVRINGYDRISCLLEEFQHSLRIILIDLAAERMCGNSLHCYSISP